MSIASYIVLFVLGSFAGWLWETFFAIARTKHWSRRGFLFGPLCPIYGSGVVLIIGVEQLFEKLFTRHMLWWGVFLVAFFGSMVLEYVTSYVLEKSFNAVWWDYHNVPLNIQGRTCVPAALAFGAVGTVIIMWVEPWWESVAAVIPSMVMLVASYLFVAVIAADFSMTIAALTDFEKKIVQYDEDINARMEEYVTHPPTVEEISQDWSKRIEAERERLRAERITILGRTMNPLGRSAIKRVKHFSDSSYNGAKATLGKINFSELPKSKIHKK